MNEIIKFKCPTCRNVTMGSVWPMRIEKDDTEQLEELRQLLTDGYKPVVEPNTIPFEWCKCKK